MRANTPLEQLRSGKVSLGTWSTLGTDLAVAILGTAGFDWVMIDMEHGPVSAEDAQHAITAACTTAAAPLVRVTWNESALIQGVLDMGAYGVLVPMVESREDAERAVADARYPPLGRRSRGGLRAPFAFSTDPVTYGSRANEATLLAVQIETVAALASLDEIAAVPGIDVLFVGPQDLATSMGLWPASMTDMAPAYAQAIESVPPVARRYNKHAGILVYDEGVARHCIALGYTFVGLHADATMLLEKARAAVRALHETSG